MAEKPYNDKESLRQFADQLQGLLDQYQSNRLVDAESKKHQKELERLLSTTNKILSEQASKTEVKDFNKLLKQSEDSYRVLKENHKEDKKFKDQFSETFGKQANAGSISQAVAKNLKGTLSDVSKATAQSTQNLRRETGKASLEYMTGPIGAMFKQYVDTSGFKNLAKEKWQQHKENRQARDTQDTQRPTQAREKPFGTLGYSTPNQQEKGAESGVQSFNSENKNRLFENYNTNTSSNRAITGSFSANRSNQSSSIDNSNKISTINQNVSSLVNSLGSGGSGQLTGNSLTGGGSSESNRLVKVYSEGHSKGFFDPLIETENSLFDQEQKQKTKFSERLFNRLKFLHKTIAFTGKKTSEATLFAVQVWWKKFQEHPIFHTLRLMAKPLTSTLMGIKHYLFGRRKDDTEKIVQSNEDIVDILTKGTKESDKTGFQKFLKNFFNRGELKETQKRFNYVNAHPNEKRSFGQIFQDKVRFNRYRDYLDNNTVRDRRTQDSNNNTDGINGIRSKNKVISLLTDIYTLLGGQKKYEKEEEKLDKKRNRDIRRNHRSGIIRFLSTIMSGVSSMGSILGSLGGKLVTIVGLLGAIKVGLNIGHKVSNWLSPSTNRFIGSSVAQLLAYTGDKKAQSAVNNTKPSTDDKIAGASAAQLWTLLTGSTTAKNALKHNGDKQEFGLSTTTNSLLKSVGVNPNPPKYPITGGSLNKIQAEKARQRYSKEQSEYKKHPFVLRSYNDQNTKKNRFNKSYLNNIGSLNSYRTKVPYRSTSASISPAKFLKSEQSTLDFLPPKRLGFNESNTPNNYTDDIKDFLGGVLKQTEKTAENTKSMAESLIGMNQNSNMWDNSAGHLETLDQILKITPTWNTTNGH